MRSFPRARPGRGARASRTCTPHTKWEPQALAPLGGGGYRWHARESPAALPCSIYSGHLMAHLRAFPRARPGRGASASETWPLSFPLPSMMLWVIHSPDNAGANTGLLPSCRHRWTRNTKLQQLRESQPLNPLRARAKVVRVSHAHEMLNRIQSSPPRANF